MLRVSLATTRRSVVRAAIRSVASSQPLLKNGATSLVVVGSRALCVSTHNASDHSNHVSFMADLPQRTIQSRHHASYCGPQAGQTRWMSSNGSNSGGA
eukprot:scaffold303996_cov49-Attheya_sp.AAC.1